ncbi:MAG: helix-turn-helix transcriptional regulator, partial [Aeromicrobium sp.]
DPDTVLPAELWDFDYPALLGEVLAEDVNHLAVLDQRGDSVASLGFATEGDKTRSARFVSTHAPAGIGDELRVLARSGNSSWGSACLVRGSDVQDFSRDELALVAAVSRDVGHALRADLLSVAETGTSTAPGSGGAGTILLGADDTVQGFTPDATRWLGRLGVSADTSELPSALRWVALQARARAGSPEGGHRPSRTRMTTTDGEIVFVQAEVLEGPVVPSVIMTFEAGTAATMVPLLMSLYGLTPRERDMAELLMSGRSVPDIARLLMLSIHTVRDHVKAIYAKLGVRSRPELTARLSSGHPDARR